MEINKVSFEQINNGKVKESFEELDVNSDGKISEADIEETTNANIKEAIRTILNSKDEDTKFVDEPLLTAKSGANKSSSSNRQYNRYGIPMTDTNTFENDVLNSSGTVYVCIGNQYRNANSMASTETAIAENLSEIQKYANVYHLDYTNSQLIEKLGNEIGDKHLDSYGLTILRFVDGKLVGTENMYKFNAKDTIINNSVGTPSEMPDVPEPVDENPGAPRNSYGTKTTNTANFQNDVLNSTGTVYVTIGNLTSCSYCMELQRAIQQNTQTLNSLATIYDLSTDTDSDLCWQIYRQGGGTGNLMGLPQVAKFVDGKFVQLLTKGIAEDTVANMIKLAEGSAKKNRYGIAETTADTFNEDVKNSKGTTYVMIGSSNSCGYCNKLSSQLATVMDEVKDKFGFYELDIYSNDANRNLGWEIYRDLGGGDGTKGMELPQIAKFVDGKFVGLLSNTRDFSGKGLDNATIKEMLEKAEGTPDNNTMSKNSSQKVSESKESSDIKENMQNNTAVKSFVKKYEAEKNIQENNLKKLTSELKKINSQKSYKSLQKRKQETELEEVKRKSNEIENKLKNAKEDDDIDSLKSELSSLEDKMLSLASNIRILNNNINSLDAKSSAKQNAINVQKTSIEMLNKKIQE